MSWMILINFISNHLAKVDLITNSKSEVLSEQLRVPLVFGKISCCNLLLDILVSKIMSGMGIS